jgi:hypothetical protein
MMKNILVVLTVLATASVASAGLFISVNGDPNPPDTQINIYPSDVVILDVTGDGETLAPTAAWMLVQGPGTISGGVNVYPGSLSSIYTYVPGSGDGFEDLLPWFESMGYANVVGASYADFAEGGAIQPPTTGKLVDEVSFHCEDFGEVIVTLADASLEGVFDTQVIHQIIPEPITLALLGIGGLFLRRRK